MIGVSEYTKTSPRIAPIVARVTMKGCSLKRAMKSPFTAPATAPTTKQIKMARSRGIPPFDKPETMIAARATTDPTERSMPPVRTTTSMPRLSSPLVTACRPRLLRLRWVKKTSDTVAVMTRRSTKAPMKA